jgi:outer membrane protein OmpA-like peptidoglycan-associated protein
MNINSLPADRKTLIAIAVATAILTGCATAPAKPDGAAAVRNKLIQLQSNAQLADRAPVAMKVAEMAVRAAEQPQTDEPLARHLVFIADRKVDTAKALAETALAEDQRTALNEQREKARLDSRTREADAAKGQVAAARADSAEQKLAADQSRADADAARAASASSQQQSAELQRQIDEMHAKITDRGVVLTLGDVLFMSGQANLKTAATGNLNKLVAFLNKYPNRTVVIEGYTDSVGTDDYNQGLSERRADGVKSYLEGQGVGARRLTALGKGKSDPVAGNDSADGRQQNRRVEVVISNPAAASL